MAFFKTHIFYRGENFEHSFYPCNVQHQSGLSFCFQTYQLSHHLSHLSSHPFPLLPVHSSTFSCPLPPWTIPLFLPPSRFVHNCYVPLDTSSSLLLLFLPLSLLFLPFSPLSTHSFPLSFLFLPLSCPFSTPHPLFRPPNPSSVAILCFCWIILVFSCFLSLSFFVFFRLSVVISCPFPKI